MGGAILFRYYQVITRCHNEDRPPLTSINVTIDPSQDRQFVEQSRQFAFKHGFRFDLSDPDQPGNNLRVRMIRKDVEVIAKIPSTPGGYEIGFYNYDCSSPTLASDIDDLVDDFRSFMSTIPNATISY
jgi:hypothetical protein